MNPRAFRLVVSTFIAATLLALPATAANQARTPDRNECHGKATHPLDFELVAPPPGDLATTFKNIEVSIRSTEATGPIQFSIQPGGGVSIQTNLNLSLAPLAEGENRVVQIPVQITSDGHSSIRFQVSGTSADGTETWQRTRILHTLVRDGRAWSNTAGIASLELAAITYAEQRSTITKEEAETARRAALQLTGDFDQTPRPRKALTPEQQSFSARLRPVTPEGKVSDPSPAGGCITVQGNVRWRDENSNLHPAFGMSVQIWDEDLGPDEFVDVIATDANGNYTIQVDNDDGIGAGDRDIYVKFVTANNAISVEPDAILTGPYEADSPVHDETPCNTTITENFTAANTGTGPSVNVNECMSWIALYTSQRNSGTFLAQILVEWPTGESTSSYDGSELSILELDRWDWDVSHHEYGHYVMDAFDFEDNPGGNHSSGACDSDARSDKGEGTRLAWGEGWPTYFGTSAQDVLGLASLNVPRVGDVSYQDTEDLSLTLNLESQGTPEGEDNEAAIMRLFWDLHDAANDGRDVVNASDATLFSIVNGADPVRLSGAWAAIRATLSDAEQITFGEVAADHGVGPTLTGPIQGSIVSPSNNNSFSWARAVGCSPAFDGDSFTLRFFRNDNSAPILSIPVGNTTTSSLTLAQFQTLVGATHNVLWGVEGSNTTSPSTGPYLGETFSITVNRPPVADAGTDITAECTSPTTTAVQLNGTASSDPDGDPITWSWSATGITFDNPSSSTPTGQFPIGTTIVSLTVSDGIESDTDQVSVTVEDTTPPVVTCPADVVVECNDHCTGGGVPSDDPQLVAFFNGVSATDTCDPAPEITDDRPACFPLGTTVVTFTACDHHTNCANCTAKVTVVDTTPPSIAVQLNREVLWPPNHQLIPIIATVVVTDVCDPNPTFVLTSITSNEPDNGLGDGDTEQDIQAASFGTSDTEFLLRSERAGVGSGRDYTIVYTASDESGNTAEATVHVRVPHDRRGSVSSGLIAKASETGSTRLPFVLLSAADLAPGSIDPRSALVGNEVEALRPVESRRVEVNGDDIPDLLLVYDAQSITKLRSVSPAGSLIGLHYSVGGTDYLVPDIFDLGPPLVVALDEPVESEEPARNEGEDPTTGEQKEATAASRPSRVQEPALQGATAGLFFDLDAPAFVQVDLFDIAGRKVRSLVDAQMPAGRHPLVWDGRDHAGRRVSSGLYFYRIQAAEKTAVKKVLIVR